MSFPDTVFVKELPEEYTLSEVCSIFQEYGTINEMKKFEDGTLLIRFSEGDSARSACKAASEKGGNKIRMNDKPLHVIPKRNRNKSKSV